MEQTQQVQVIKSEQTQQNNKVENVIITADSIPGLQQVLQVSEPFLLIHYLRVRERLESDVGMFP